MVVLGEHYNYQNFTSHLKSPEIIPIVVFAQVPPPEHGQSKMVQLALETLRQQSNKFDIHHINARFSNSLEDIGEGSFSKMLLTVKYLAQAIKVRVSTKNPILYYVPGPVKWSSILRDWVLLSILRLFYQKVIFHWHAIGQGEWANGSDRLKLDAPKWLDSITRKISSCVLNEPFGSISVSPNSRKDAIAVSSRHQMVLCNGIQDPCPDFEESEVFRRIGRSKELEESSPPCFKILFFSHGTIEKGVTDSLLCIEQLMENCNSTWKFELTFAGGISESARSDFDRLVSNLLARWPKRITVRERGYLTGKTKNQCFQEHDVLLASSRWESFGLTVIEAMAYGLCIVAAESDGVRGVLPENYPFLGHVANPNSLAIRLQECCCDFVNGNALALGKNLRKKFLDTYQIDHFSDKLVEIIIDLGSSDNATALAARSISIPAVQDQELRIQVYLADQNPGFDRSIGISRMSQVVLAALINSGEIRISAVTSRTSQQPPLGSDATSVLPWGTRQKLVRLLTDHFHPIFSLQSPPADVHYFPKGYLPLLSFWSHPSVVTIHDTIIQYDEDRYPTWRKRWEYAYWAKMLKRTLRTADSILTVSESSKKQIQSFMDRHLIPRKEINVTYEPCLYERFPQPENPDKENFVIHLASCEPHKRTSHLIRWWHEAESKGNDLPMLHLIGTVPSDVISLVANSRSIVKRPFLEDYELQEAYRSARALILPSEIEGFGLPALEAYYLGTPVCFVRGTSVEEILSVATTQGGFSLEDIESLFSALNEVLTISPSEIRECGLKLRETYASAKIAQRMIVAFREGARGRMFQSEPSAN